MHGDKNSSGMKYYKKIKNLNYIYSVPLNTVLKLFNQVYTKKIKSLFSINAVPF